MDGCAVSDGDGQQHPPPMALEGGTISRAAADGIQTRQGLSVLPGFQDWPPPLLALAVPMAMAAARLLTLPPSLTAASVPF